MRKVESLEYSEGAAVGLVHIQMICQQCQHVSWFTDRVLEGI